MYEGPSLLPSPTTSNDAHIKELPDVTDMYGNAITPRDWSSAGVYWRDLPEFALMFREYAIGNSSVCCVCQC
jgi:hypothetical protein